MNRMNEALDTCRCEAHMSDNWPGTFTLASAVVDEIDRSETEQREALDSHHPAESVSADHPECSGDPACCPENEGFGCCKPSDRAIVAAVFEHFARARASGADHIPGCTCDICEIVRRARELDSHRPAESVSAEPVAWMVTRDNDPSFPRIYTTEAAADAMCKFCNVAPTVRKAPIYLRLQPSTPGAVSDEWSPTIDDMPEGICVAKRIHVERSRHMDNWFVGFGKDESCQIEGTANHWYWLAYALLGLVDEKDSPYSEDKPLPFSPAYIRAALESFAKRSATPKEDRHAQD
jgi:hypothetical protein